VRDRAILVTLLYHGLRREELCALRVKDIQSRQGVMHFRIKGKRDKKRIVPVHVTAQQLTAEYLALAGHGEDAASPLFRPVKTMSPVNSAARSIPTRCTAITCRNMGLRPASGLR
jgi:integrase/recombinase XerD